MIEDAPKMFPESYVRQLRAECRELRRRAQASEARARRALARLEELTSNKPRSNPDD
jgi:hypothetical protein